RAWSPALTLLLAARWIRWTRPATTPSRDRSSGTSPSTSPARSIWFLPRSNALPTDSPKPSGAFALRAARVDRGHRRRDRQARQRAWRAERGHVLLGVEASSVFGRSRERVEQRPRGVAPGVVLGEEALPQLPRCLAMELEVTGDAEDPLDHAPLVRL